MIRISVNQSKKQDKRSVDTSTEDSANTEKVAGTTIRQLRAKIIYRKVNAEKIIVERDIQNLVNTGRKNPGGCPRQESVFICTKIQKNMRPMSMVMNCWPVKTMSKCATVMIVKSIYATKVTQEHMVKHRKVKVTIVRNANTKAKTQDFWRVIERKNRRASIKMSIKNGWKK